MLNLSWVFDWTFLRDQVLIMVGVSIATMVFMLALFYMAAQFFKKPEYEALVTVEIYQLFVSILLIITVFTVAEVIPPIAASIIQAPVGADPYSIQFTIAQDYLNTVVNKIAVPVLVRLEWMKMTAQWWGSVSYRWGLTFWGATMPGFPSFVLIERVVDFLLLLLSPFVSSLIVQQIGLEVIRAIMIPFVLPMGAILRIFPPTRDAGSFLISTALAFQIIFPFTYVMHARIVKDILIPAAYQNPEGFNATMNAYNAGGMAAYASDYGLFDIQNMFWTPLLGISFLLLQALFLPALSITLTVAFIKGFNKFISQKLG